MSAMSSTSHLFQRFKSGNPTLHTDVTLGVLTRKCKGMGICSVTLDAKNDEERSGNAVKATLQTTNNQRIDFIFERKSLSESIFNRYFSKGIFTVEEAFIIPQEVLTPLQLTAFTIEIGTYPIKENNQLLIVSF